MTDAPDATAPRDPLELDAGPTELEEAAAGLLRSEDESDEALDPIELARRRLDIDATVSDLTIAASLAQIAARTDARERWLAAFGSPIGRYLAQRGSDLNTALNTLQALSLAQRRAS